MIVAFFNLRNCTNSYRLRERWTFVKQVRLKADWSALARRFRGCVCACAEIVDGRLLVHADTWRQGAKVSSVNSVCDAHLYILLCNVYL